MKAKGDTGAYLRMTMGAMVLFGVPPEPYWPYTDDEGGLRPGAARLLLRLRPELQDDSLLPARPGRRTRAAVLDKLKTYLAAGHPAMFGFTVYSSIEQAETTGRIPVPFGREQDRGRARHRGHGLRRRHEHHQRRPAASRPAAPCSSAIPGARAGARRATAGCPTTTSSRGLAEDFWSVLKKEWIDTGEFKI